MRRMRGLGSLGSLMLMVLLAAVSIGGWFYADFYHFAGTPLAMTVAEVLDVPRGTTYSGIVHRLQQRNLSDAPNLYWRMLAKEMRIATSLHAGEYALPVGMTPRQLLHKMADGEVIQHHFTIVEGWTFRDLRAALAKEPALTANATTLSDAEIMAKLGEPGLAAEGRFLPETYAFVRGDSDFDLLRRARAAMKQTLTDAWNRRVPDLPLVSADEVLILASIIEKETGRVEERSAIAGVFVRRLRLGMLLQTDPTVIYGLGEQFDGNLRRADLDTDTPYNTYRRAGLPPTPIALPGKAAIEAATHPAGGNTLYFVARGDGWHEFSDSLDAHNRAVAKYQLRRRR